MSDTARLCLLLQAHTQLLSIRVLAAEGTKEYKADWLKNADTVVRDGTGKFAKKGTSIAQSVRDATTILKQGFDLTTDTIQSLLKDPEFRKRAGLAAGLPMAKLISNLATQARLNPKLTEKLDEWIANATKEFADQYGDDKSPIAQAIRNSKLTQPPKDASFNDKMEFRVAQFAAYKEALESPEDYSKRDEIIGKAAVAAIPIGVSLAIALGFEVAIPLFMAQGVNWATVLSSVAIGEAADFAVQKGMDKLEINNPVLRIGASMVAGILAGGLVTGVNNKIKNARKLAKEEVKRLAKEESEILAKQESERKAKQETERLAKVEAEYEAIEKSRQETLAELTEEQKERMLKKRAEREAKYKAQRLAREKAEQETNLDIKESPSGLKKQEEIIKFYDKELEIDLNRDHDLNREIPHEKIAKHEEAIKVFDEILKINPDNYIVWNKKGLSLSELGKNASAINAYDEALRINPEYVDALRNKGWSLDGTFRPGEATEFLDKALEIDPKDAYSWTYKGFNLESLGKDEEAIEAFDKALEINSKNLYAWSHKGEILRINHKYLEAIDAFDEALKIDPGNDLNWFKKGVSLDYLGKYKEAVDALDETLKIKPNPNKYEKNRYQKYKDAILKKMDK